MIRKHLVLALVATVIAAACGHSPTSPTPLPPNPPPDQNPPPPPPVTLSITRILCFGDSMTAGTTSPSVSLFAALTPGLSSSYPYKLQDLLTARYNTQATVVANAGQPSERATDGRNRLGGPLSEARPELVILLEGANDLNSGLTDVSPIVGAMEDMVREATGRGSQVMLATLPPQRPGGNPPRGNAGALLGKYNSDLKTMASKKGAILIDVNALLPLSMIGQDGLHPTEAGYQKLAEIFLGAISERYEVKPPTAAASITTRAPAASVR